MKKYLAVYVTNEDETVSYEFEAEELWVADKIAKDEIIVIEHRDDVQVVGWSICPR
jgi:hypothetical protein